MGDVTRNQFWREITQNMNDDENWGDVVSEDLLPRKQTKDEKMPFSSQWQISTRFLATRSALIILLVIFFCTYDCTYFIPQVASVPI